MGEKSILENISLQFELGKNYLILWKNGSGKSSLSQFLMGNPIYQHISWSVHLDGNDLLTLDPSQRAQAGLFLSFQNIPEIPGVKYSEYLRTIYNHFLKQYTPETKPLSPFIFERFIKKYLDELHIDSNFLQRDLNVWFSGWEKRKLELLQSKLLSPKYMIFDEIDSGLDVNAFQLTAEHLQKINSEKNTIIIITHHFQIVEYLDFDIVYILENGTIKKKWGKEIIREVQEKWFT